MIELKNVSKSFDTAEGKVDALKDVSITIEDGDIYGIIGMSGAGKSTLVRCINMLEKPTSGEVIVNGKRLDTMSPAQLRAARRNITMIFQQFNLLMQRNCLKNVCFPMELAGASKKDAQNRAKELLALVGLPDKAKAYPAQLSGGQQQRIAIARALATNPKVLLCDEATSALDPKTTRQILELIRDINKKLGITVVIITHQMSVVKEVCNHVAILDDGIIAEEGLVSSVFTSPKSEAARHLVFPGGEDMTVSDPLHERRLKLTFLNVAATSVPLVARLATEEGISANVISATTQKLSDEIYGSMLLGIPNSQFEKATAFLKNFEEESFIVNLWDGEKVIVGEGEPQFTINIKNPLKKKDLINSTSLAFGEAYMNGNVEFEGDLYTILDVILRHINKFSTKFENLPQIFHKVTNKSKQKEEVTSHYDIGNDFYSLWVSMKLKA